MMNKFSGMLLVAALGTVGSSIALGDVIDQCATYAGPTIQNTQTVTLTADTGLGSGCAIGGTTFSNFQFYGASIPTGPISFSAQINVDLTTNQLLIDTTGLNGTDDVHLTFQGTAGVTGMVLTAGIGDVVSEGICGSAFNIINGTSACGGTLLNTSILQASNGGSASSVVTFASTDYFYKDISGGSEVTEGVVPEPMTLSLMGVGLLGLGFLGRRVRK